MKKMTFKGLTREDFVPGAEFSFEVTHLDGEEALIHYVVTEFPGDKKDLSMYGDDYFWVESKLRKWDRGLYSFNGFLEQDEEYFKNFKFFPAMIGYDPSQQPDEEDDV